MGKHIVTSSLVVGMIFLVAIISIPNASAFWNQTFNDDFDSVTIDWTNWTNSSITAGVFGSFGVAEFNQGSSFIEINSTGFPVGGNTGSAILALKTKQDFNNSDPDYTSWLIDFYLNTSIINNGYAYFDIGNETDYTSTSQFGIDENGKTVYRFPDIPELKHYWMIINKIDKTATLYNTTGTIATVTIPNSQSKWFVQFRTAATDNIAVESGVINLYNFTVYSNVTGWFGQQYNLSSYELFKETFLLNLTNLSYINPITPTVTSVNLYYNGTLYPATTSVANEFYSRVLNLQQIYSGASSVNHTFYWNINVSGTVINTSARKQAVYPINLTRCDNIDFTGGWGAYPWGGAGWGTFINFTYKNELTLVNMNATIDSSTWEYWLDNRTNNKTLFYLSSPEENESHGFCFTPANLTLNTLATYRYSATGYPQRGYSNSLALTNVTTNNILYLLSSTDGGYVTFQVVDAYGSPLAGALVTITKTISGTPYIIGTGFSDNAGTITFWLDPNSVHTVSASKTGCSSSTQTITPTGSTYSISLSCTTSGQERYYAEIEGLTYQRTPADGVSLPEASIEFGYYVKSRIYPMTNVTFLLYYTNGTTIKINSTLTSSGFSFCNATECLLRMRFNPLSGDRIKGKYYVDLGNGSILLEGDAYWMYITRNDSASAKSFDRFMIQFNDLFDRWGTYDNNCREMLTEANCRASSDICKWAKRNMTFVTGIPANVTIVDSSICIPADDINKGEFSRIVFIFFMLAIALMVYGKLTQYELTNPGAFILFMIAVIWIGSIYGLFTFAGLTGIAWFNKYLYALVSSGVSGAYLLSLYRRYQQ